MKLFFLEILLLSEKCITGKYYIRHAIMHSSLFAQNLKLPFYIGITNTAFFRFSYIFSFSIVVFPVFRFSTEFYTVLYCEFVFYSSLLYSNLVISYLPRHLPLSILILVNVPVCDLKLWSRVPIYILLVQWECITYIRLRMKSTRAIRVFSFFRVRHEDEILVFRLKCTERSQRWPGVLSRRCFILPDL